MFSDRFLFVIACELTFIIGRFYLLTDERTVFLKLSPVIPLCLFLIHRRNYLHVLEFLFYMAGDYFLFFVTNLSNQRECFVFGMFAFLLGHLIAIYSLNFSSFEKWPLWFTIIWFFAGLLIGFILSTIENRQLSLIINAYIFVITSRLTLTLLLDLSDSLSIILFCLSDLLILIDLFHFQGSNILVSSMILILYWISLILRCIRLGVD